MSWELLRDVPVGTVLSRAWGCRVLLDKQVVTYGDCQMIGCVFLWNDGTIVVEAPYEFDQRVTIL